MYRFWPRAWRYALAVVPGLLAGLLLGFFLAPDALRLPLVLLATLATIGSTSPYVGLFGTVWGIMNSFRGLANVGQATLASVAPGIAEALIATAMGLFAAIPAVIGFNHFVRNLERLSTRFDSFMEELSNRLQGESDTGEEA